MSGEPGQDKSGRREGFETLPLAVIEVDADGQVRRANAAAAELFSDFRLTGHLATAGPGAALAALAARARETGAEVEGEVSLGPSGRAAVAASRPDEAGVVTLALIRMPRQRAAPAAAGLSAARTLAHEVRNPLAGIRAAAQLIVRETGGDVAELAQLICDEVDRVRRLTDRIDPLAGLAPLRTARVNVHEALGRVRALILASSRGIIVRERYDPSLPALNADLDQLIQAFLNIAQNAADALRGRSDGEVLFATGVRPGVRVRAAGAGPARTQLEIQIIDNGPGLAPEIAERLFEAFATTKRDGMGLGLTVAADIIARHGGGIEVETAPGRTAFRVLLPIEPEAA